MNEFVEETAGKVCIRSVVDLGEDIGWRSGSEKSRYNEPSYKMRQRRNKKGVREEHFIEVAAISLFAVC